MDAAVGGFRRPRRVETDERDRDLAAVVANVPGAPALASRATVPVEVTCTLAHQLPQAVEVAAYYVVSESLTNMARHARATRGSVGLSCADETLIVQIADDGVGGADPGGGSGLRGLHDRIDARDGTISVSSEAGRGTTLSVRIPLGSADDPGR